MEFMCIDSVVFSVEYNLLSHYRHVTIIYIFVASILVRGQRTTANTSHCNHLHGNNSKPMSFGLDFQYGSHGPHIRQSKSKHYYIQNGIHDTMMMHFPSMKQHIKIFYFDSRNKNGFIRIEWNKTFIGNGWIVCSRHNVFDIHSVRR